MLFYVRSTLCQKKGFFKKLFVEIGQQSSKLSRCLTIGSFFGAFWTFWWKTWHFLTIFDSQSDTLHSNSLFRPIFFAEKTCVTNRSTKKPQKRQFWSLFWRETNLNIVNSYTHFHQKLMSSKHCIFWKRHVCNFRPDDVAVWKSPFDLSLFDPKFDFTTVFRSSLNIKICHQG